MSLPELIAYLFPNLLPNNPRHLVPIKFHDRVLDNNLVLCTSATRPSAAEENCSTPSGKRQQPKATEGLTHPDGTARESAVERRVGGGEVPAVEGARNVARQHGGSGRRAAASASSKSTV